MKFFNKLIYFFTLNSISAQTNNAYCGVSDPVDQITLRDSSPPNRSSYSFSGTKYVRVNYHFIQDDKFIIKK